MGSQRVRHNQATKNSAAQSWFTMWPQRCRKESNLCCREANSNFVLDSCFFDFLFVSFVIIIHDSLPQRTLPLCLTVRWSAFVQLMDRKSDACPPVNSYNKKKRLTHCFQQLAIRRDVCKTEDYFTSLPHCLSISVLLLDLSHSLLLSLVL